MSTKHFAFHVLDADVETFLNPEKWLSGVVVGLGIVKDEMIAMIMV